MAKKKRKQADIAKEISTQVGVEQKAKKKAAQLKPGVYPKQGFEVTPEGVKLPLTQVRSQVPLTEEDKKAMAARKAESARQKARGTVEVRQFTPEQHEELRQIGLEKIGAAPEEEGLNLFGGLPDVYKEPVTREQITQAGVLGLSVASLGVAAAGAGLAASAGLTGAPTASAASGRLISQKITERIGLGGGRVLVNTYNAGKVTSYLGRLVQAAKQPHVVLAILATGLYTSFFWAPNEKGDAMITLAIAQREALKAEDFQSVLEIGEAMKEANDIQANIPAIGFTEAERAKFKASIKASDVYTNQVKKQMAEAQAVSAEAAAPSKPLTGGGE